MKRIAIALGVTLFLTLIALSLFMAPDMLSMLVIGVMIVMILLGCILGLIPSIRFIYGFRNARTNIQKIMEVQPDAPWLYVQQHSSLFQQSALDSLFRNYIGKAKRELQDGKIIDNIESQINEESLALRSWQGIVQLIPGTMTAIGLAGTFIGLILGISSIGFSSVEATIGSIEELLGGIRIAFYTSIIGLIYSILFNIVCKFVWNLLLREMSLFTEDFHVYVLPTTDEQLRQKQNQDLKKILTLLERLPKVPGLSISAESAEKLGTDVRNEQQLINDVQAGIQKGEFIFYVQPRCDLNAHTVIGGEALMRWNHSQMGMISPIAFLPVLEKNGYIVKIDRYIWEAVCVQLRRWMDEGKKPVPVSINISKTDILTMDVTQHFVELTRKYRIPPRYLELEFASNAYLQCGETMRSIERELRLSGFRIIADGFDGDFTTMNVLKDAEVDAIKLDLRYVEFVDGQKKEMIMSVFDQANAMQVPMVVEGIESAEELNILRRCGFKEGQGYYLYKPLAMDEFKKIVGDQQC